MSGLSTMSTYRGVDFLRWICVLPAAVLGTIFARTLAGTLWRLLFFNSESVIASWTRLLVYAVAGAAFVLAGALVAPRNRGTTAVILALAFALLSLLTHVISQDHPGTTNFLHLAAETAGAALAIAHFFKPTGPRVAHSSDRT